MVHPKTHRRRAAKNMVESLRALRRQQTLPQLAEVIERIIASTPAEKSDQPGGLDAFVKIWWETFKTSKAGSPARARMLADVTSGLLQLSDRGMIEGNEDPSGMTEEELDEKIREQIEGLLKDD